ncbi:permease of the major facilitator superfamily [Vibrio ishigakensis]|uniref:Permease of the major facilitator superfamily n=1 Tax=Vibrio ishigakensis TaxID=1481914 RepID=A0A0B8PEH5_9VIBR|nr:permease of the major facilitator superfamily [Vibrio ishigakensis]
MATIVLVGSIVAAVVAFWKLHELPIHKAQQSDHRQLGLVTILTWIGFVWHWVWVIAIIVAFADIESSIVRLRDLWRHGETSVEEESC